MNTGEWRKRFRQVRGLDQFSDLNGWRDYYLNLMLFLSLIVIPLGMIASFKHFIAEGRYYLIVFDVTVFLLLIYSFFNMKSPVVRSILFFFTLYAMILTFLVTLGPYYARPGWLVFGAVTSALLFGTRAAVTVTGINAAILVIFFVFIGPHLKAWASVYTEPSTTWIMFIANISLLSLASSIPVSLLLNRLNNSFHHESDLLKHLTTERETLKETAATLTREMEERLRAESELRTLTQRLNDIIEFIPDATFVIDQDKKIIAWNKAIEEMTGVRKEDMLNKGNHEYSLPFYGERKPILIDLLDMPDEEIEAVYKYVTRKDGKIFAESYIPILYRGNGAHLWGVAAPLYDKDGKRFGSIEVIKDVTYQKIKEEALKESEERYRILAENARDVIWVFDINLGYIYVSPSVERLRGYTPEEALKQPLDQILTPESYSKAMKHLALELEREKNGQPHRQDWSLTTELEMLRRDGSTVWVEVTVNLLYGTQGAVKGLMGISRDISERKRAERDKSLLENQLIHAQKMEALGTLAGGIAHDFNNILSAVIGYAELCKTRLPEGSESFSHVSQILNAGKRAKGLVQQILTFSRQSRHEMKPTMVNIIVKEALHLLRATIPATVEIRQNITGSCIVMSDPTQIHQILMNLCTNAAHAMEQNGGVIDVRLEKTAIKTDREAHDLKISPGAYIMLSISDTGHGMAPDVVERIFEPYFTTKEIGRGTGLGLAVVHGIVMNHGGSITCSSMQGKGSTFTVYLPEVTPVEGTENRHGEEPLKKGTERILFVDDEQALADLGKNMMEDLGYRVVASTNSIEALDLFRREKGAFDLVVTDMTMPGMTGDRLAGKLMEIRPDIPIILCTGYSELITAAQARDMGIRGFITKPLEMKTLADDIRRVLDKR